MDLPQGHLGVLDHGVHQVVPELVLHEGFEVPDAQSLGILLYFVGVGLSQEDLNYECSQLVGV